MDTSTPAPNLDTFDPADEPASVPPNTPPVPAEPPVSQAEPSPLEQVWGMAKDALVGIARGEENMVAGTRKTARGIADATGLSDLVGDRETNAKPLVHLTTEPQGLTGDITSALTTAGLSWATGGVVAKSMGLALAGNTMVGAAAQTALGSALTSDPSHARLSNILMQWPIIGGVFDVLASNPTDSFVVGKAKAIFEESFTSGGTAGLFNAAAEGGKRLFNALHLVALKFKGAPKAAIDDMEKKVIADQAAAPQVAAPKTIEELNPVQNNQAAKNATQAVIGEKYGDTGAAFRAMKPEEMRAILRTGKVQVGDNPEGISAQLIGKKSTAIYHEGDGMVVRSGDHQPSGHEGEVHVNETADPTKQTFMIGGKEHSFDEAKAPMGIQPKPPITLKTPTGEPLVTLTPAKQKKFEAKMRQLIVNDAIKPTEQLPGGPMAKEGTLNADHAQAPNVVMQGLKDLGDLTKDELGPKVVTHDATRAAAEMLGLDHDTLIASFRAANKSMESAEATAVGMNQYIQLKGTEMLSHAKKGYVSRDVASNEAFKQTYLELAQVQAEYSQFSTRVGRTLNAMGIDVGPFDAKSAKAMLDQPFELETLQRLIIATDGDANQVAHIIKMQQLSWIQKAVGVHNEAWIGGALLSRLATQTANLTSTAINTLMEPASMVVGGVERGIAGQGWAEAREGVALFNGLRTSFFDSMHMGWQAIKTDKAILSPAQTSEQPTQYISALTFSKDPATMPGMFIDILGKITRASFRGLTGGDEAFKQLSYRAKISATASREAVDMVRAGTLQRSEVSSYVGKALKGAIDEDGAATNADALKYAEKVAFVSDLGGPAAEKGKWLSTGTTWGDYTSMGEAMARLASGNPLIRGTVLPFVKTPTNVTRTTFEYTPLIGQLRKQFYTDINAGGEKQALAMGKLTIGAGMYAGAAMLALDGRITGAPPPPGVIMPTGWKPYSFRFPGMGDNGGDLFISHQRLQPFSDILGLTADFTKSTGMLDPDTRDQLAHSMVLALTKVMHGDMEPLTRTATAVGAGYGKSLISKTYFRNMTEFFSTFSGYNNENAMIRWVQNYTASHVPGMLSQFNSDDTVREVRSTMDAVMARIPGLSQMLPPKRNYFGEIHDTIVGKGWSIIQPLAVSQTKADPVMAELNRLSTSNGKVTFSDMSHQVAVGGKLVDLKAVKNDAGVTAYDRMNDLMQTVKPIGESKTFHEKLSEVMHGPRYKLGQADTDYMDGSPSVDGTRTLQVKAEEYAYRDAALEQVKNEFASQLGIKSARQDAINTRIGKKKVGAGLYDKILEFNK